MSDTQFEKELEIVINKFSQENNSNTPDFILARFITSCLHAWNVGIEEREKWYGRAFNAGSIHTHSDGTERDGT